MKKTETKYHFIGLGGAGCNILEFFYSKEHNGKYTCITNLKKENLSKDIRFIRYCSPRDIETEGILADMTIPLILPKEVKAIFTGNYTYVLLAGLGSYTGTYMTEELTIWLQENNKDFVSICCTPFFFEGDLHKLHAERVKNRFQHLPNFKFYDLDEMRKKYGDKSFSEGLEMTNNDIYKLFENLKNEN